MTAIDRDATVAAFFDTCPLPAAIADRSGRLVAANLKLTELLGHRPGGLDGLPLSDLIHPEDQAATLPQFRGAQPPTENVWLTRYRAASGEWVALRWYSAHDPDTGLIFGVAKDVRETDALSVRLTQMAYRDELTGLANRHLLLDTLRRWLVQAQTLGDSLAVLLIDVDGLKALNDGVGHHAGDAALAQVGGALTRGIRLGDLAGRLAGDEFVVAALHPARGAAQARSIATRMAGSVLAAVQRSVTAAALDMGASVGVAVYPWSAEDVDGLIRAADAAMYDAKQEGGNRVAVCPRLEQAAA
jgi:diguanylate cyclase (GGDEF)-like protein/PAS domain S-box-containing protein